VDGTVPIIVVKCGGSDSIDADRLGADIADVRAGGGRVVLVHGGGADIDRLADELRVPDRTLHSPAGMTSRYTHPAMLDVVVMALVGRTKPRLLGALARVGVPAVGLTGLDGGLLRAARKPARRAVGGDGRVRLVRDDRTGRIIEVDPTVPAMLLSAGMVPVVSPPAAGDGGSPLNVDADRAAAALAVALGAARLVILTGAPGLLRDVSDPGSLLTRHRLPADGSARYAASDGMHRKLLAAGEALRGGVRHVRIADGRLPGPLSAALSGAGTEITMEEPHDDQR
jgi:acetylglutamate/LysW-gamma-L-alpha-aminoadipate kinase